MPAIAADLDAGERRHTLHQRRIELMDFLEIRKHPEVGRVARPGQLKFRLDDSLGVEAGVYLLKMPEALDQKARPNHEHDGERNLSDHQARACNGAVSATGGAASLLGLQHSLQIDATRLRKRHEPEDESNRNGDRENNEQHARIDGHFGKPRDIGRRSEQQHAKGHGRDDHAQRRRKKQQDGVLDDVLACQPPDSSTQRASDRDLPHAHDTAREQKMCDVDARNQEHERDGRQQDDQRGLDRPEDDFAKWLDKHAARLVVVRVRLLEVSGNRAHLLLRSLDRRTRRETADDEERMRAPRKSLRITLQRSKGVDRRARITLREAAAVVGGPKNLKNAEVCRSGHHPRQSSADDR